MRCFVAASLCALPVGALAHHDTATRQVGSTLGEAPAGAWGLPVAAPRLELGLSADWLAFGRLRRGGSAYAGPGEGAASVQLLRPSVALRTGGDTRAQLSLPVGRVSHGQGAVTGPGDLYGAVAQELGPLTLQGGLSVPTGRYVQESVLSITEPGLDRDGTLSLTTYDTRASLGAGAWRAQLDAGLSGGPPGVTAQLRGSLTQPLTSTPDGIRWGTDAGLQAGAQGSLLAGRAMAGLLLDGRLHTADRPPTDDGSARIVALGRRRSIGGTAALGARLSEGLACSASARLPLAQWVEGVQLVETSSVSVRCLAGIGL